MASEPTNYESFHRSFTDALAQRYPVTAAKYPFHERVAPTLVSPYILELPESVAHEAQHIVQAFFRLRQSPAWQARARQQEPSVREPGNTSILMSYDFHIDAKGALRLIEINTNASLSLIANELHRFQNVENVFSRDFQSEILDSFAQEFREARTGSELKTIGIVDQEPLKQRLFIEFAMYQELFASRGWSADFYDPKELSCTNHQLKAQNTSGTRNIDLVYNRDTDFYFTSPESEPLREAMNGNCAVITPHPWEYRLLADKDRLLDLSRDGAIDQFNLSGADKSIISHTLIRTLEVNTMNPDELWADRKHWFFKPRRSHGGKAVYRGSSTSRGTFQSILAGDYLAQEMVPPPVVEFDGESDELKYDLRFYVYRDKIQLACARLYRGQMTNSQSLGGGISPIRWMPLRS